MLEQVIDAEILKDDGIDADAIQFRDRFLDFLRANYTSSIDLSAPPGPSSRR